MKTNQYIVWLGILPALIVPAAMAGLAERPRDKSAQHCTGWRVAAIQSGHALVSPPQMAGKTSGNRGQA